MLRQTFIHVPGIGEREERRLWKEKILTWDDFLLKDCSVFAENDREAVRAFLRRSAQAAEEMDHRFFSKLLPAREHWRVYRDFEPCYLDIETTGLSRSRSRITMIGLHTSGGDRLFVNGKNLEEFEEEIARHRLLVTFNGQYFDLPFIRAHMPGACLDQLHIDLRWPLRRLGYTGGLKSIERQVGLMRSGSVRDIDGLAAVRLWKKYEKGDKNALRLLADYNLADVRNLKILSDFAYDGMLRQLFKNL